MQIRGNLLCEMRAKAVAVKWHLNVIGVSAVRVHLNGAAEKHTNTHRRCERQDVYCWHGWRVFMGLVS